MITTNIHMLNPNADNHLLPIAQLAADVFTGGKHVDRFCQNYIGNSHYDWNIARVILDGEKLIHHWGVWGYRMWVESVQLKVAGIGAVATHADYRKQGLMHQAAQSSFDAMLQDGYDLSLLQGQHYVKIGYARAWNNVTYRMKLEELPELGIHKPYQPLGVEDVGKMDALYNQTHAGFTGTAIRPTYRNRHPNHIGVYAWFDEQGKLEGYIRALPSEDNPKILECLEAAGDLQQELAVLGDILKNGGYESLAFVTLPHQHPMLQWLRKGACIVEDHFFSISGWRVRIVNLHSTLKKLIPLLENRLAQSQFATWQGSVLLDCGQQKANIKIEEGKVDITSDGASKNILRGGPDIARFLIGSDEPEEIIRQADMVCNGLAIPLARVLFPNLHPMLSDWDGY